MRFGRLTILGECGKDSRSKRLWECQCDCGEVVIKRADSVKSGATKSCGCLFLELRTKHGHNSKKRGMSPTYQTWNAIKDRCLNSNHIAFHRYGGRGITMCVRWRDSFENFLVDMGERPSKDYSLDRINNDGNYEPGNCRWITKSENSRRKRLCIK